MSWRKDVLSVLLAIGIIASILSFPYVFIWTLNIGTYPTGVLVTYFDTPVMGLNVHAIRMTYDNRVLVVAEGPTDAQGFFRFQGKPSFQYILSLTYKGTEFSKTLPGGAIWDMKLPVIIPGD